MSKVVKGRGFFAEATVEQFPETEALVDVTSDMPVDAAFDALVQNKIHCAPVLDAVTEKYVGFLDVSDIVAHVTRSLQSLSGPDVDGPDTFLDLRELVMWANRHVDGTATAVANLSERNPFKAVAPSATLLEVLELLGTKGLKRIPVQDAVSGKITKLITQGSLSAFLLSQPSALDGLGDGTVGSTKLGLCKVIRLSKDSSALRSFELMLKHNISAVAITEGGSGTPLVGTISDTDMRSMITLKNFNIYGLKVWDLLTRLRPGREDVVYSVTEATQLRAIPALFEKYKVHRLFVVDDANLPIGVITFKDLLAFLLSNVKKEYTEWAETK